MKKFIHSSESGQALILLVLAVVGLLGFTALAIDGGMVYADRRHAQNATDAASLAGGGVAALQLENSYVIYEDFDCNDYRVLAAMEAAKDAAVARAGSNDFGIDKEISDNNGVVTECVDDLDNGAFVDKYIDVRTMVTMQTRTSFIHFVYNGPLINTVEAVTRIRPNTVLVFGNAIVSTSSLCDGNDGGVTFDGGGNPDAVIKVNGGGIFSNSCLDTNGGPKVEVTNGGIGYVTDYSPPASGYVSPPPQQAGASMPEKNVPAPDCFDDSMQDRSVPGGSSVTIQPGRYDRIRLTGGGELVMEPGLYCVTNDFTANNGTLTGNGVTIYMIGDDFSVSGNVEINLTAPPSTCKATMPNVCPPAQAGMLIYMAEGNEGVVTMEGNSESHYTGTVYAPDGTIDAGGGSSTIAEINAQLIGDTVKVHGNVTIDINFIGAENFHLPSMLELFK
jgi:Flp pilus assembly protein TadG